MAEKGEFEARGRVARRGRVPAPAVVGVTLVAAVALVGAGLAGRVWSPPRPVQPSPAGTPSGTTAAPTASFAFAIGDILTLDRDVDANDAGVPTTLPAAGRVYVVGLTDARARPVYRVQTFPGDRRGGGIIVSVAPDTLEAVAHRADPACPGSNPSVEALARLDPFDRVACYGDRPLELPGVVVSGDDPDAPLVLRSPTPGTPSLPIGGSGFAVNPTPDGRFVDVVGHFDDPVGVGCGTVGPETLLVCRERFFVTSIVPGEPPAEVLAGTWRPVPQMPVSSRYGAAVVWDGLELVVLEGFPADVHDVRPFPRALAYRPGTRAWARLPDPPGPKRWGARAVTAGRTVVLLGGSTSAEARTSRSAVAFDIVLRRWRTLADVPFPLSVDAEASALDTDRIVVASPDAPTTVDGPPPGPGVRVAILDLHSNHWTELDPLRGVEPAFGLAALHGAPVVVSVGPNGETSLLRPGTHGWDATRLPNARSFPAAVAAGDGLLMLTWQPGDEMHPRLTSLTTDGDRATLALPPDALSPILWTGRLALVSVDTVLVAVDPDGGTWRPLQPLPSGIAASTTGTWTGNELIVLAEQPGEAVDLSFVEFVPDDPDAFRPRIVTP
ncbi:MAG TPA: hypothetical protein VFR93_05190 [Candidatus Limnocylindrales bacterium]|nr:hypothetical protein [Candidatus Limnocylindrales bacterium]